MLWNERYKIAADPSGWQALIGIGEHIVRPFIDQAHLVGDAAHNLTNGGTYKFVLVPDHGIDPNGGTWSGYKGVSIPDFKEIAKQTADWQGSKPAWAAEAGGVAGYAARSVVDKIKALRSKLSEPHPTNPDLMARKNEWDTMDPRAQDLAIGVDGPTVNPHHPQHDITNEFMGTFPRSTRPPRRQSSASSAIEVLSARLGALGCLSCARPKGKAKGKCPKTDGQSCREVVQQRMRDDSAASSGPQSDFS